MLCEVRNSVFPWATAPSREEQMRIQWIVGELAGKGFNMNLGFILLAQNYACLLYCTFIAEQSTA